MTPFIARVGLRAYNPEGLIGQLWCGAIHIAGMVLRYIALPHSTLADTTPIGFAGVPMCHQHAACRRRHRHRHARCEIPRSDLDDGVGVFGVRRRAHYFHPDRRAGYRRGHNLDRPTGSAPVWLKQKGRHAAPFPLHEQTVIRSYSSVAGEDVSGAGAAGTLRGRPGPRRAGAVATAAAFFGRPGLLLAAAFGAAFGAALRPIVTAAFLPAAFFGAAALAAAFFGRPGPRFTAAVLPAAFFGAAAFLPAAFLPAAFFGAAAFLAAPFLPAAFFGAAALAAAFFGRPGPFFAAAFLAGAFFAGAALAAAFLPAAFLPAAFFAAGFFAVLRAPAFIAKGWADGCSIVVSSVLTRVYSSSWQERFQTGISRMHGTAERCPKASGLLTHQ